MATATGTNELGHAVTYYATATGSTDGNRRHICVQLYRQPAAAEDPPAATITLLLTPAEARQLATEIGARR